MSRYTVSPIEVLFVEYFSEIPFDCELIMGKIRFQRVLAYEQRYVVETML